MAGKLPKLTIKKLEEIAKSVGMDDFTPQPIGNGLYKFQGMIVNQKFLDAVDEAVGKMAKSMYNPL